MTDVRRYAQGEPLPEGVCPGCRSARPPRGRRAPACQACSVAAAEEVRALGGWLPRIGGALHVSRETRRAP